MGEIQIILYGKENLDFKTKRKKETFPKSNSTPEKAIFLLFSLL